MSWLTDLWLLILSGPGPAAYLARGPKSHMWSRSSKNVIMWEGVDPVGGHLEVVGIEHVDRNGQDRESRFGQKTKKKKKTNLRWHFTGVQ